ncbi:STAS domain-containing protein [Streptomyces sp. NBC_01142]|uniref:STAS domain-containing protein n=1 Tax=Streptomyces sp. NBC_01142 TaxID=2975865 RepID=UPI00224E2751|nr:STAS domain-containing protein [Streptomyces sp. NBC_01142]MCX4827086.1 STAS domain-containing protein [Streptomyces sp. NBC_01142]
MAEPDQEQQTVRLGHAWLTYTQRRPHTVLTLGGEFFVYEAPSMRTHLAQVIGEDDGDLILVTRDVTYFDSTCIGALIRSMQQLEQSPQRALRIVDSGVMAKILRLTGLANVIDLHATVADAHQAAGTTAAAARAAPV